jgi:SAM-dependent MidA family methyltransferase
VTVHDERSWMSWREATHDALYGPRGFYVAGVGPDGHFRTSVHASDLFAAALVRLAREAGLSRIVDVGSGRGELLRAIRRLNPGVGLLGIDVVRRPSALPVDIGWLEVPPSWPVGDDTYEPFHDCLVVANEWLDNVPVDCVEVADGRWHLVYVDQATGDERLGAAPAEADLEWLDRWWPETGEGHRGEIGAPRDQAWGGLVGLVRRGLVVAMDYGHVAAERAAGDYAAGTLAGYREGRVVPVRPDCSCDITAHVAMDSCDVAGRRAGATDAVLTSQRRALLALGVGIQSIRGPLRVAGRAAATSLRTVSEASELIDPGGLGSHYWLVQAVGCENPLLPR